MVQADMGFTRKMVREHIKYDDRVLLVGHYNGYLAKRCSDLVTIDPRPGIMGKGLVIYGTVNQQSGVPCIDLDYVCSKFAPTVMVVNDEISRVRIRQPVGWVQEASPICADG